MLRHISGTKHLPRPPTVASSGAKDIPSTSSNSRGSLAIDEAVRLAMKKQGAFVKLTQSEFARLLDLLMYPVRPELIIDGEPFSNMLCVNKTNEFGAHRAGAAPESEEISLPVVHTMSLAATMSFAIRDGNYLNAVTADASERRSPQNATGLVAMTETQSEKAIEQLKSLLEGNYSEIKKCVLQLCAPESPLSVQHNSQYGGLRPSSWTSDSVKMFLSVVNVTLEKEDLLLDGALLLQLDLGSLKRKFSNNPSIDQTRLAVYVQSLKHLDQWWERGIRPGDLLLQSAEQAADEVRGIKHSKRRSSKQNVLSSKWGDLSEVMSELPQISEHASLEGGMKKVEGGNVIQSHLLQIADFQPLLEAMTPLNRAFGWGCSIESLVKFASIVGGMRCYLWVKPSISLEDERPKSSISFSNLSHASSMDELKSHSSWTDKAVPGDMACWVVLQKSSVLSATELTQLVRLGNDLSVVMKYAAREDDFLAYIPLSCLRVTSAQEIKAQKFEAELQGMLLEELSVGKNVVVAGIEALTRTCERFDWWDRPTPLVLQSMSGQVGEVVSMAEVQEKRRVGVRLLESGLCDALPIESLRLCTAEELHTVKQRENNGTNSTEVLDEARIASKTARRKSKALNSETRKTKLRTLIRNLNTGDVEKNPPTQKKITHNAKPRVIDAEFINDSKPAPYQGGESNIAHATVDEITVKSDLSNLSGDEEELARPRRSFKNNKRPSFSSKLRSASPLKSPVPVKATAIAEVISPTKSQVHSVTPLVSPQKRIVRRKMVRNDTNVPQIIDNNLTHSAPLADDEVETPHALPILELREHNNNLQVESEYLDSGRLLVNTDGPLDYSWLREPKRSPLLLPVEVPAAPVPPPPAQEPFKETEIGHPLKAASATISILKAKFDDEHAEYTDGVMRYALPEHSPKAGNLVGHEPGPFNSGFQAKFVRRNRPQSAPSTGPGKRKTKSSSPSREHNQDTILRTEEKYALPMANSSFGLSGVGYVGGGGLQQHSNQWVNEDIPAVSEADIPKKIPNKRPLVKTEYRNNTQKLFEFHDRNIQFGGNGHIPTIDPLGSPARPVPTKTIRIPQRPKSANPTSRGVSKSAALMRPSADAQHASENVDANGGVDLDVSATAPTSKQKRSREDELRHIAAAQSNREQSLKEKVLVKELKRLGGKDAVNEKIVV